MNGRLIGLGCAAAVFALDQSTKALALGSTALAQGVEVLPVLNLVLVRNEGVSFGMLGGVAPWWALAALGVTIVAVLLAWLWRGHGRVLSLALGLVIGGALSNILDRARHGAVTDFLDLHLAAYHWPAFNLADVAVVTGTALLLLDGLRDAKRKAATGLLGSGPPPSALRVPQGPGSRMAARGEAGEDEGRRGRAATGPGAWT